MQTRSISEEWQAQLDARMARFQRALDAARAQGAPTAASVGAIVPPGHVWGVDRALDRRLHRALWQQEHRERRRRGSIPRGIFLSSVAVWLAMMAATRPYTRGWLIWIALAVAFVGVRSIARAVRTRREAERLADAAQPAAAAAVLRAPSEPLDPRIAAVDALCDRLKSELAHGPRILTALGQDPEKTADSLRRACHELVRRESALRQQVVEGGDQERLAAERKQLVARIASEVDRVARDRFKGALAALDEKLAQRIELMTAAARLEAEHARLYYTLQNLHAQVLRVKSADAASPDVAGAGLKYSVEKLGAEMEAVASALESVNRGERTPEPVVGVDGSAAESASPPRVRVPSDQA